MRSIDAVSVKLSRGSFTLLAENAAFVVLEEQHGISLEKVGEFIFGETTRIRKLCEIAAVFAKDAHPDVTADQILKAAPTPEDLKEIRQGLMQCLANYLPPKKAKEDDEDEAEGGGDANSGRPSGSAS